MWTGSLKRSVNPKEGIKGDGDVLTFFFLQVFPKPLVAIHCGLNGELS